MATLIEKDIYKMIIGLLKFPYPQICRHLVALELLSLLEKNGYEISEELAKYISKASECDSEAIDLIVNQIL